MDLANAGTLQLLLDIELLNRADYFVGTINSGLPHLIDVLRFAVREPVEVLYRVFPMMFSAALWMHQQALCTPHTCRCTTGIGPPLWTRQSSVRTGPQG